MRTVDRAIRRNNEKAGDHLDALNVLLSVAFIINRSIN
jgi:hypothetical protein